jgi:1-deoxy-D-xylulose-5-phosphate reductoisomerase
MNLKQGTKRVLVLGATGSIGRQTLSCIADANAISPGTFSVIGLSANHNHEGLKRTALPYPQALLALATEPVSKDGIAFSGEYSSVRLVESCDADIVVNGISGSRGLAASIASVSRGMNLALANKESVVMGWHLLKASALEHNANIIPVDSEHAALFQLLSRIGRESVAELTITASGGPFRKLSLERLAEVTPDDAARHPTWAMGRKISIDSASLANKGLELIEAVRLFDMEASRVKVLIHPESIVHALVRAKDSSLYAQMSSPDMRLPIQAALYWPKEMESAYGLLDLAGKTLNFEAPDTRRFPMLELARQAAGSGQGATVAYNAANEVAVEAFDAGKIRFVDIPLIVAAILEADWAFPLPSLGSILDADARARRLANEKILELR